ncbi:ATP-dependent Clp protease proteolytic subunit [Rhizobium puerariae]|uniref:ATP-dependent Clp protease proteolytic subunit n=1 Tax=Rhizobium puerariae TaxID=1585791 RepID=A0ABV6AB90_9HYPH
MPERSLREIGQTFGWALPAGATSLRLTLVGPIGRRTNDGRGILPWEVGARIAANSHVPAIEVELDSGGGAVVAAKEIHDMLTGAGKPVTVRVIGQCCSAAILVLLAGQYREAVASARFLIHGAATAMPPERWTAEIHRREAEALEEINRGAIDCLVARCGGPRWTYERLMECEDEISAYDALTRFFLIDRIIRWLRDWAKAETTSPKFLWMNRASQRPYFPRRRS